MKKTNYIFLMLAVFAAAVVGCAQNVVENDAGDSIAANDGLQDGALAEKGDSATEDRYAAESSSATVNSGYNGNVLAGTTSKYIEFNTADYDKALSENKKILLYFYASWCPICRAEQPKTFAAFDEIDDPNLIGFRVNYKDSATDKDEEGLAKQFGVAYQHTKVILKDGKQAAKFPDTWDKQRYLDELAKV